MQTGDTLPLSKLWDGGCDFKVERQVLRWITYNIWDSVTSSNQIFFWNISQSSYFVQDDLSKCIVEYNQYMKEAVI